MFKKVMISLLVCSSMSFSGSFDFYLKSSRAYWDVITDIPEMEGLYANSPDGMVYILSEASGKDYCWLKEVDSNGLSDVRKFYVDWTNGKYTPETYGRAWNEICKNSKRKKKFIDTDGLIYSRLGNIEMFVNNYSSGEVKIVKLKNSWRFDWYVIRDGEYDRDIIGYRYGSLFKVGYFSYHDSIRVLLFKRGSDDYKELYVKREDVCGNFYSNYPNRGYDYTNSARFLKILRRDSVIDFDCSKISNKK